jgi:hypothetical protein
LIFMMKVTHFRWWNYPEKWWKHWCWQTYNHRWTSAMSRSVRNCSSSLREQAEYLYDAEIKEKTRSQAH